MWEVQQVLEKDHASRKKMFKMVNQGPILKKMCRHKKK